MKFKRVGLVKITGQQRVARRRTFEKVATRADHGLIILLGPGRNLMRFD